MNEQLNIQPDPSQVEQFDAAVTESIQARYGDKADLSQESVIAPDASAEVGRSVNGYGGVKNFAEKDVAAPENSSIAKTTYSTKAETGVATYNDNGMRNGETTSTSATVRRYDKDGNEIYQHTFKNPTVAAKMGALIAKQTTAKIEQRNSERAINRAA